MFCLENVCCSSRKVDRHWIMNLENKISVIYIYILYKYIFWCFSVAINTNAMSLDYATIIQHVNYLSTRVVYLYPCGYTTFNLLFISYKFVKGFLAITFLLLVISSWNFHDVCQRFLYNQERNFSWIRQKMRIFPIDLHYKNRPLL